MRYDKLEKQEAANIGIIWTKKQYLDLEAAGRRLEKHMNFKEGIIR
jgi:hypothetical protein